MVTFFGSLACSTVKRGPYFLLDIFLFFFVGGAFQLKMLVPSTKTQGPPPPSAPHWKNPIYATGCYPFQASIRTS